MPWYWNEKSARYHWINGTQVFMSSEDVMELVALSIHASGNATDQLARMVTGGLLSPEDWRDLMRQEIKDEYIRQYLLGRGGLPQMGAEDWGSIGGMLKEQYGWLDGLYEQVLGGELSEAQVANWARMYGRSAREAFERANARANGGPDLPQYPGDGKTQCLTNCQCNWEIESVYEDGQLVGWNCTWVLGPVKTEHCDDCVENAEKWTPLFVANE